MKPIPPDNILRAVLSYTVKRFRLFGGIMPISVELTHVDADPEVFKVQGNSLLIEIGPRNYHKHVELVFRLLNPEPTEEIPIWRQLDKKQLLTGIAFASRSGKFDGQVEFPTITVESYEEGGGISRQITVVDKHDPKRNRVHYDYVLMVQDAESGDIGIIDPDIENKTVDR